MIGAMVMGSIYAFILNQKIGIETTKIATVGKLTKAIPPLSMPDFSLDTIVTLAPAVVAITFLALTEAIAIAKSIAVKSGQRLDGNQEFIGQGLSNIIGSFFSSYVATGSFNRSGVNYEAKAKTPLVAAFSAVFLIIILLFVAPLAVYLPVPSMAAILLLVAYGIIDIHQIKLISKTSKGEASVLYLTFFSTLILHLDTVIIIGVIASFIFYLMNTSHPHISVRVPNKGDHRRKFIELDEDHQDECPQLKFVRIDGSLFFGALGFIEDHLEDLKEENSTQKHLCLFCQSINFLDTSGAELLVKMAKEKRALGGGLYLYKVKPKVLKTLETANFMKEIGMKNIFDSKGELLNYLFPKFKKEICNSCDKRIFNECETFCLKK